MKSQSAAEKKTNFMKMITKYYSAISIPKHKLTFAFYGEKVALDSNYFDYIYVKLLSS